MARAAPDGEIVPVGSAELGLSGDERGRRDGSPVDPSQIHMRANKYPAMFEKDGRRLRLTK